jgi:hypothetical protein
MHKRKTGECILNIVLIRTYVFWFSVAILNGLEEEVRFFNHWNCEIICFSCEMEVVFNEFLALFFILSG